MDNLGSFESLDWMLTTDNGFRVMMCSGRPLFRETFDRCRVLRPNVLLRQAGLRRQEKSGGQISALELAKLLVQYGAQLIFPFHFDVIIKKWGHEKTGEYMDEVARHVRELDPGALFVFPEALKWYSVDLRVTAES